MLTDLIIESAIRESGEKRSSLEMICMADMEIQIFFFVHLFLIFNRQSSSKKNHNCLNKTDYWGKISEYLSCDYFNKSNNNIIVIIRIIIYRSVAHGLVLLAELCLKLLSLLNLFFFFFLQYFLQETGDKMYPMCN